MLSVKYTVYRVVFILFDQVYNVQCTFLSVYATLAQCTLYNVHYSVYIVQSPISIAPISDPTVRANNAQRALLTVPYYRLDTV